MGTTVQKVKKAITTKENLRVLINNSGGAITENDKFSDYPVVLGSILSGLEGGPTRKSFIQNRGCEYLFAYYNGSSVSHLISYNDTNQCTNMRAMFIHCLNLITIPQLDTSACTDMSLMFSDCVNLTTIPQLDTSKVINMNSMFSSCKLKTTPQLNTSSCTNMNSMFQYCKSLTTIDITHMNNNNNNFANNCISLTKLIIRNMDTIPTLSSSAFNSCYHFYGTTNSTYNPNGLKDGRIYVPDDKVEELKAATNWSVFADIIVPLSTLVE